MTQSGGNFAVRLSGRPDGQYRLLGHDGSEHPGLLQIRYVPERLSSEDSLYGMPLPMAFCAFVGALYAQSAELHNAANGLQAGQAGCYNPFDVVSVLYNINSKIIVLIASIGVIMATITTCVAANVVAPANGFSNLSPKRISYKKGVTDRCLYCLLYSAGMVDLRFRRSILHLDERLRHNPGSNCRDLHCRLLYRARKEMWISRLSSEDRMEGIIITTALTGLPLSPG